MVIPEEREGKTEDDPELSRNVTPANKTVNPRKGDQSKQNDVVQKVFYYTVESVEEPVWCRYEVPLILHCGDGFRAE